MPGGLRVLFRPNTSSEITSIVCLVRAGLPDERDAQAGIAAVTAEALLKGTTTRSDRNFAALVTQAGGSLQSQPGFDFTEISIVAGREQLDAAVKLIGDVIAHPRFDQKDVDAAKTAVRQRQARFQDDFTGASYQTLLGDLYPAAPYGRPMNGLPQTVDRLTRADVQRFWQDHYTQDRVYVAIVGDATPERAMSMAEKAFRDVPSRAVPGMARVPAEALSHPRVELITRAGPAAQLMIGFLTPGTTRAGYPLYALLDAIIGGGKRARLFTNIREKHSLGYEMGSFYQPLVYQSHLVGFVITPSVKRDPRMEDGKDLIEPVKALLLEQYRQLALTGPTDQELARAKSYVVGRYALREERTRDQAKWLAWNEAMRLGADFDRYFPTAVAAVTKEQIQAAAKRVLTNYALVVTVPPPE